MGEIDNQMKNVPTPSYKRDQAKTMKYLSDNYTKMLTQVVQGLNKGVSEQALLREMDIVRQTGIMMAEMNAGMEKQIDKMLRSAFGDGQAYHLMAVGEASTWGEAKAKASFNRVQQNKIDALVADTYEDILMATHNTEVAIKNVVRSTVAQVAQYHSLRNNHYDEQAKDLFKQLSKKGLSEKVQKDGFVGITDKAGRKWDLGVYSNMVIKTKTNQAFSEGIIHEAEETGIDLAIISDHSADDACSKWEGVIISMTGATQGFPTYAQARATNQIFHPNCEHTFHPVRNLDLVHPDDLKTAQAKAKALQIEPPKKPKKDKPKEVVVDQEALMPKDLTNDNIKIKRDYGTQVNKKIKKDVANQVYDMLETAPASYQKVWEKYQNTIIYKRNGGTNAFYRHGEGVTMSLSIAQKGKSYQKPMQVFFHEFAHNIDYEANKLLPKVYSGGISFNYENRKFDKALKEDFEDIKNAQRVRLENDLKESMDDVVVLYDKGYITSNQYDQIASGKKIPFEDLKRNITDKLIYRHIQHEINQVPFIEVGNISDIFEGLSNCGISGGVGHGKKYWQRESALSAEAFAEFYDSQIANKEAFAHMAKYFPKGLMVFEEILDFINNGG